MGQSVFARPHRGSVCIFGEHTRGQFGSLGTNAVFAKLLHDERMVPRKSLKKHVEWLSLHNFLKEAALATDDVNLRVVDLVVQATIL